MTAVTSFLNFFISGSSDTLEKVISGYKGSYPWDFGLDHTNAAANSDIQARNGYTMVLSKNLEILRRWDFVALITNGQKNELKSVLNLALGNVVDPSEFASGSQTDVGTLEILLGGGLLTAALIVGGVVYTKRNQTIRGSSEHFIQQKSQKQKRQLTELKQVLNKQQAKQQSQHASISETQKTNDLKQKSRSISVKKGASKRLRRR